MAVAFLTTGVKSHNEDDWRKLKSVLKCLNGSRNLKLTLSTDYFGIIRWFVDASYAVHNDYKGHTGTLMILGQGAIASFYHKEKLNTKS